MNKAQYDTLSQYLYDIAPSIPLNWGQVQNDRDDGLVNIFSKASLDELNNSLTQLPAHKQNYLRRRWFLWQCSKCDEYLFYNQPKVLKNPNPKDQQWDVELLGHTLLRFDIKSTILPKAFRSDHGHLPPAQDIIRFYFDRQSRGRRNHIQNRIFLVHLPYAKTNSNTLRTKFKAKQKAITEYIYDLSQGELHILIEHQNCLHGLIYLKENKEGSLSYKY